MSRRCTAIALLCAGLVTGCTQTPSPDPPAATPSAPVPLRQQVTDTASDGGRAEIAEAAVTSFQEVFWDFNWAVGIKNTSATDLLLMVDFDDHLSDAAGEQRSVSWSLYSILPGQTMYHGNQTGTDIVPTPDPGDHDVERSFRKSWWLTEADESKSTVNGQRHLLRSPLDERTTVPDLSTRLTTITVTATSPDANLRARVRGRRLAGLEFRPGAYDRYRETDLAHQLARTATLLFIAGIERSGSSSARRDSIGAGIPPTLAMRPSGATRSAS